MPFMPGGELFHHFSKLRKFPEKTVQFYATQLVLALGYLHSKGFVYRDIKSENILVGEDGYICLTDFGLAKKIENDDKAYSFVGTPDYLAPEIIIGNGHDRMVDWWSLGILMYLLTILKI